MTSSKICVNVGNVKMGPQQPVVLQSMTNTDTSDVSATVSQILELERAGSQMVRITVNNEAAAGAVAEIVSKVRKHSLLPVIGDFHFNGNILLQKYPECAQALDKYRINPGNAQDTNFREMVEVALKYGKPIRIGVNSGSIDAGILDDLMATNAKQSSPTSTLPVLEAAAVKSVLASAKMAEDLGLSRDRIVLSAKMSEVGSMIRVYETLAAKSDYVLHLGLTEAGGGESAIVASAMALGTLLHRGIG